jgi:pyruvate-ferredoxin/flavodoxin oxidoreductase
MAWGSRDFRPEHTIGAYEFVTGGRARKDGKRASDGVSFMVLGVDHPYEVRSEDAPSLLPEGAIAVRFHSVGGWGAITTGKNLGAIIGDFNDFLYERDKLVDELGNPKEIIHVSANPKYGSEKKGAPTAYFMVAAPERIRVNCDLRHVTVVLCCDPKAFTHTNPLDGMSEGGCLVWESEEEGEQAWQRLPIWARQQIIEKNIRVFTLPGFQIARSATDRADLQLRMQGNAFLGAFFAVSPLLHEFGIRQEQFKDVVQRQYQKKFGKLGDAVVKSNMEVMTQGFERVREIRVGELQAPDRSTLRGRALLPIAASTESACGCRSHVAPEEQAARTPLTRITSFDREFRAGLGYNQPASPLASLGVMAAGSGDTASKYVARRETPLYIPENCTQCMDCIAVCPDTALPNCSQDLATLLKTAVTNYVSDAGEREKMLRLLPEIEQRTRVMMREGLSKASALPLPQIVRKVTDEVNGFSPSAKRELFDILERVPMAYQKANAIFSTPEKKSPGAGGVFSIFVSDLCKGCAACVTACGDHKALRMVQETEDVNAEHETGTAFLNLLPDTSQKYLGLYNDVRPQDSKTATLRNMLMVRRNYDALVSGDGACAGCGEKSILRTIAAVTEAYMRPIYHAKADRLRATADDLERHGPAMLAALQARSREEYELFRQAVAHLIMGLGGEDDKDTRARMAAHGPITDRDIIDALTAVMRQEAFNHKNLQPVDGRLANGMSVMAMAAHTGCNTVYGSTPPNNPHPYPWMNSLFQDGITVGWLLGESFIVDHGRRSVIPSASRRRCCIAPAW